MLEIAAGLSIKKALHKLKEEIHDNAEIERIDMEMSILKGENPIAAGNTIQTYKHVDEPTEKQKYAVTQFAKQQESKAPKMKTISLTEYTMAGFKRLNESI